MSGRRHWVGAATLLFAISYTSAAAAGPDAAPRTLDEAPELLPGEWWRVAITDRLGGLQHHGFVVVQDYDDGFYTFGVDDKSIHPALFNLHALPIGRVGAEDFSYDIHGARFHALDFPLEEGKAWTTDLGHGPARATVTEVDGETAKITYRAEHGLGRAQGVYDARLGFFSYLLFDGVAEMRVLDHGLGYACQSYAPVGLRIAFDYPASNPTSHGSVHHGTNGPLGGTTKIGPDAEFLTLSILVGSGSGLADTEVVTNKGTLVRAQADAAVHHRTVFRVFESPEGVWTHNAFTQGDSYAMIQAMVFGIDEVDPFAMTLDGACDHAAPTEIDEVTVFSRSTTEVPRADAWSYGPGTVAFGAGAIGLFALFRRYGWAAIALYAKLSKPEALNQPQRGRILALVRADPGITTQDIRHELGLAWGTTVYHVSVLEQHGLLVALHWGRNRHWFEPTSITPRNRAVALANRRPQAHRLLAIVERTPGQSQGEIARELNIHHATLIFHAKRLEKLGLLEKRRERGRIRYFPAQNRPAAPMMTVAF